MKKLTSLLLAVLMIFTVFSAAVPAFAAQPNTLVAKTQRKLIKDYDVTTEYDDETGEYITVTDIANVLDCYYYYSEEEYDYDWVYYGDLEILLNGEPVKRVLDVGKYTITVNYAEENATTQCEIEVIDNPVEKITATQIAPVFRKNGGGYYNFQNAFEYTVEYNDGREPLTGSYYEIYSRNDCAFSVSSDQDEQPWSIGKNTATASLYRKNFDFEVEVTEDPLRSITAVQTSPIYYEIDKEPYEEYPLSDHFEYTVEYSDGTPSFTGTYEDIVEITDYNISFYGDDSANWTVGKHDAVITYGSMTFPVEVEISENPVESISVSNVKEIDAKTYGKITGNGYSDTPVYKFGYDPGAISFDVTVNMKDGSSDTFKYHYGCLYLDRNVVLKGSSEGTDEEYYDFYDYSSDDCIVPDEGNVIHLSLMGCTTDVTLPIVNAVDEEKFGYIEQDGKAYITDYYGTDAEITVPAEIDGLQVAGILDLDMNTENRALWFAKKLIIPDGVTSIADYALSGFDGDLILGKDVAGFTEKTFAYFGGDFLSVSEENPDYAAKDNMLYTRDLSKLIAGQPQYMYYRVPDETEDISVYIDNMPVIFYYQDNKVENYGKTEEEYYDEEEYEADYEEPAEEKTDTEIAAYAEEVLSGKAYQVRDLIIGKDNDNFIFEDGVLYNKDKTQIIRALFSVSGDYEMPDSVTVIAKGAFCQCNNLTSVNISENVTDIVYSTFRSCTALESVEIPDSVQSIGESAFASTGLTSVDLNKTKNVGENAFCCSKLSDADFGTALENIGQYAFGSTKLTAPEIPDTVKTLEESAFADCQEMESVHIGKNVSVIPEHCFSYCDKLSEVTLDNDNTVINAVAFRSSAYDTVKVNGRDLICGTTVCLKDNETLYFPESVTNIVYFDIQNLADTKYRKFPYEELPVTVRHIGENTLTVAGKLPEADADGMIYLGDALITGSSSNTKLTVKEGTRILADNAFGKLHLTEITLPEGLEYIGSYTFCKQKDLKKITLPSTLKEIGSFAFAETAVTELVIPASLTSLKPYAFTNSKLTKITVDKDNPAFTMKDGALYTKDMKTLVYLPNSKESYTVPTNVTTITEWAFSGNETLQQLYLHTYLKNTDFMAQTACRTTAYDTTSCDFTDNWYFIYHRQPLNTPVVYVDKGSHNERIAVLNRLPFDFYTSEKHEHTPAAAVKENETAATCQAEGSYEEVVYCAECGEEMSRTTVKTEKTDHSFDEGTVTKEATCAATGTKTFTCTVCGEKGTETIAKTAHTYVTSVTKATQTKAGKSEKKCSVCGKISSTKTIPAVSSVKLSYTTATYTGKTKSPTVTVKDTAGKTLVKNTDYTVTYSNNKNVGKASAKITFKGNYTGTKTLTFKIIPGKVTGLTATPSTTSIKLSWDEVPGAKTYRIYQYSSKEGKYVEKTSTTKLTYTASKLNTAAKYTFYVKASKTVDGTKYLSSSYASVSARTKLSSVTNLKATQTTSSVKLSWSKVKNATGYKIYKYSSAAKKYTLIKTVQGTSYTVKSLKAGTAYTYYVRAYKTISSSTTIYSTSYTKIKTGTKTLTPKAPTLTAGTKKITVKWSKVTGASGYQVQMKKGSSGKYSTVYTGTKLTYTKSSLTRGSTYYFKVRTYKTVDGKNIYSAYSTAKTAKAK